MKFLSVFFLVAITILPIRVFSNEVRIVNGQ